MSDSPTDSLFSDGLPFPGSIEPGSLPKTPPNSENEESEESKAVHTPYVFKPEASYLTNNYAPVKGKVKLMNKDVIDKCQARQLDKAIQRDMVDLIDDVFRGQTINWVDITEKMTLGMGDGDEEDEGKYYNPTKHAWGDWPHTNVEKTEEELCTHLNTIAAIVRKKLRLKSSQDDLVYSSQFATKGPTTEFTNERKPDLVVVPRSMANLPELSFEDFRSAVSLKSNPIKTKSKELFQLAEYARVCFALQRNRRFYIGIGFRHTTLTLYVFDRSGALASRMYDVHKNPVDFLRIAIGVLLLDPEQLGYDTTVVKEGDVSFVKVGSERYKISRYIFVDRSIRGRGTICLKAESQGKVCVVVKDSWVDRSRPTKEAAMLQFLRDRKVPYVAIFIAHQVVKVTDRENGSEIEDNTNIFRKLSMDVGIREHHRIVMQPYGQPFKAFSSLTELLSATLNILDAIEFLDKEGVIHRDISLGNLVLAAVEGSELRKGFLIDFDYAIKKDRNEEDVAKGDRTGTIPFMAIEILKKYAEHSAIHDAESLFYVLIWIAFIQAGPGGKARLMTQLQFSTSILFSWSPQAEITEAVLQSVADSKVANMKDEETFVSQILGRMDQYFDGIGDCLLLLREALFPPTNTTGEPIPASKPGEHRWRKAAAVKSSRVKGDVFRKMREALKKGIETLSETKLESDAQSLSSSATEPPAGDDLQPAVHHLHSMKLRNFVKACEDEAHGGKGGDSEDGKDGEDGEDGEDDEVQSMEDAAKSSLMPVLRSASKKEPLLNEVLRRSVNFSTISEVSKKRSIHDDDDQVVEADSSGGRAAKRSKSSDGSARRSMRSMTSANNDLK